MRRLARQVRFTLNPFLKERTAGANSFCAAPCGRGLAIYFAMWVELQGQIDSDTGFVLNVVDIDEIVRDYAVSIFDSFIKNKFAKTMSVSLQDLAGLMKMVEKKLDDKLTSARPVKIELELTPNRKLGIRRQDDDMMYFGEKFEFAASHTLWNKAFSKEKNFTAFGKCANPAGHGHNYVVEVVVKKPRAEGDFEITSFEETVERHFIRLVDHKNLNADVEYFSNANPTVENIAAMACEKLQDKLKPLEFVSVTVWENQRTYCTCMP